jgi:hypothetical protein
VSVFTRQDVWLGSFYELAIEVGDRSDDRLHAACVALWSHGSLEGPYGDKTREPGEQPPVSPGLVVPDDMGDVSHLYGVATLPDGNRLACGCVALCEEDSRIDWLDLYIPLGALDTVYDYDYGDRASWRAWAAPLDDWFADIGRTVYDAVPFRLALVGEEVSGMRYASQVAVEGIPDERNTPLLFPDNDGALKWYPATT